MRFNFTIRDLLWLALVAALVMGWWLESSTLRWRQERLAERLAKVEAENKQLWSAYKQSLPQALESRLPKERDEGPMMEVLQEKTLPGLNPDIVSGR